MTIFGLNMMVKSGLEKNILKSRATLQSCCPARPNWPGWLAGTYLWRGMWDFKIIFVDHFSPSYLSQKWSFQDLRFQSTYSGCFKWFWLYIETSMGYISQSGLLLQEFLRRISSNGILNEILKEFWTETPDRDLQICRYLWPRSFDSLWFWYRVMKRVLVCVCWTCTLI